MDKLVTFEGASGLKYVSSSTLLNVAVSSISQERSIKNNYEKFVDKVTNEVNRYTLLNITKLEKLRIWDKLVVPKTVLLFTYTPFSKNTCKKVGFLNKYLV
uniref:Uncharacterized protein n=1 Tax=Lepeophtheirus salmonis TaxID=72036 RepID=A0A0K2U2Z1_LEPSM